MTNLHRIIPIQILVCLAIATSARAADPIIGNWKVDLRASTEAGPPLEEHTESYRELASGEIEFVITRIAKDGKKSTARFTWPAEGGVAQDPAGALGKGSSVVETLLGPGDWLATFMVNGKQTATIHKVISPDGKTMTQAGKLIDPQGRSQTENLVFHRQ